MGFLTGTLKPGQRFEDADVRSQFPRFTEDSMRHNKHVVDLIAAVAARHNATLAQVALAWLLARKPWIVPIPGTRHLGRLQENLAAGQLTLSADDVLQIDEGFSQLTISGDRMNAHHMGLLNG